jgi:cyanophycin synthetase
MRIREFREICGPNIYNPNGSVFELTLCPGDDPAQVLELVRSAGLVLTCSEISAEGTVLISSDNTVGLRHVLAAADSDVESLRRLVCRTAMGPSTRALIEAAERRSIPWRRLDDNSLVQLGYGKHRRFVQSALTSDTSSVAVDTAANKSLTKDLLAAAGISVPHGVTVRTREDAVEAAARLRAPVVVKPLDAAQGKGVFLDLHTPEDVGRAFKCARALSSAVIVEEQLVGRDYRVLIVAGRVVAASERTPAQVSGDGTRTIGQLIEQVNSDPRRGDDHDNCLTKIVPCPAMFARLERLGLTLDSVPEAGQPVTLLDTANLSKGGTARDVTDHIHPSIARMCERAARIVGLDICGVDLIAADITRPLNRGGGIVELNAAPGLRMHLAPSEGRPRDVAAPIIDALYPEGANGRIPITAVAGTADNERVPRIIAHVLSETGSRTGAALPDGVCIDGERISGACAHPVLTVLSDPCVESAIAGGSVADLARDGLGCDWVDVAVITDIPAGAAAVQKLTALRVRARGTLVLNADDPQTAAFLHDSDLATRDIRFVLYSTWPASPVVRWHLGRRMTAFFVQQGWIYEAAGAVRRRIAPVPEALDVQQVLAAVAACRSLHIKPDKLAAALRTFECAPVVEMPELVAV